VAGSLGIGVAQLVLALIGLVFFPWGGVIVAVVGLLIILAFLVGFVRRSAQPRP